MVIQTIITEELAELRDACVGAALGALGPFLPAGSGAAGTSGSGTIG
ncbi:hypothetical protein ACIBCA_29960 [Kitasatospora sp. NPDC051170]